MAPPVTRTASEGTIAAISTPPGEGAIGIVRLSGPDALRIAAAVFHSSRGLDIRHLRRRVYHGEIRNGAETLDEVLLHIMRAPHSYTREDVVEINAHGGAEPLQAILELVLEQGARLAEPGEFTKRAFLNGRLDLVQAEAVIDRIRAKTRAGLRAANAAASGALSQAIAGMREPLLQALARIEASVDFPDEDLPELVTPELRATLAAIAARMETLLAASDAGRLYREGAAVIIAGRPNVGKSSLFNALLRDARAIVTARPGTTRDLLEEVITVQGIPIRLSDTAGLRHSDDEVERIGVDVARSALNAADAVLFVVEATDPATPEDEALAGDLLALEVPVFLVVNKIDLNPSPALSSWADRFAATWLVSAKSGDGLQALEAALAKQLLGGAAMNPSDVLLNRVHQRDSLRRARQALARLLDNFGASPEFLSIDLREALAALGEITGETTAEDVLDRIFASFCIGK
ncbi:MAG TPA: tRNA uridine-5-carboxymethylaminomethyl(34) synthesis GTPase MnmE [Candidatus Hydrogenedentes bacterium]|jgi:tRNA modification GTPase|nr:tRNA uridine-5-carboxymethylaminomethyl(34) synthesis GTPase MnmE [Candidatus Hydrogenedentota bacterium]HPJ99799.1 tRNA uridine-5-carboxymethylaminomethyl(34) synthesis GTPase MnmE [Candidatus Hydrogenedentota bacterium]